MRRGESQQPFASPGEALKHHGVKGQKWGVRKEEETSGRDSASTMVVPRATARNNEVFVKDKGKPSGPGTPEFQRIIERVTRTDHPQVLMPQRVSKGDKPGLIDNREKHGLTRNQKMLLAFGAVAAAGAGYYAYQHYAGGKMPGLNLAEIKQNEHALGQLKLPAKWDVSGLSHHPLSTQQLGNLAAGDSYTKLRDEANLVINTSRGYADILPKDGFSNPFAAEQHASATRVLEEMREKFPAIRNMNVEVVPFSKVQGLYGSTAQMCVMPMRAGEARVAYNDMIDKPTRDVIRANSRFLPGLGKKDYVAYHEMGHLLAVAHGEMPPAFDTAAGSVSLLDQAKARDLWQRAEPLLHKRTFAKHGFSFKELSKISGYAATQPAEAMAELIGHAMHPEMRSRLTPDQLRRADVMINEMGGLT